MSKWIIGIQCNGCNHIEPLCYHGPRVCPECGGLDLGWTEISIRRQNTPSFWHFFGKKYVEHWQKKE